AKFLLKIAKIFLFIEIERFIQQSLLNKLIENKKYISDKSCLDIPLKTDKLDYLLDYDQTPNCHENINKYIFFDNLHPTNSIHKKIAFLASRNF
ncbi:MULTISPECIES: hypothetical protein, partial [unclassified Francisella]|uniref:hypothetical protein n=1 Tax=unclassified Francisella TaxID=2610885 RepID=UPI002E2F4E62